MKKQLAAAWTAVLLSPCLPQAPAFAQQGPQGPAMERQGGAPMMGWHHGPGGWGMMGGSGHGMMGAEWNAVSLTKDQRNKINAIHRGLRDKQFALMDRMHDSMQAVRLYRDGKFDEQAARNAYAATEKLRRQMFENMIDAQKQVDALLTPEQRQQLSQASQ